MWRFRPEGRKPMCAKYCWRTAAKASGKGGSLLGVPGIPWKRQCSLIHEPIGEQRHQRKWGE